ncbi:MAG: permease [Candidatus Omnitrophica bacterium]|nr:permease [Candidatus Omnitrophota bacterium]
MNNIQESLDSGCCHTAKKPFLKNKLFIISGLTVVLLFLSLVLPFLEPFRKAFLMYFKTIWWAVLLGLLLGGVIDYYIPKEYISKILSRKKPYTIFNAVFLGFLMSACSHGILALSIQLHKKGASNPAVVSFLLASPWANLAISVMLVAFFGLKGLLIIIAAIVIAINTGFIFMFLEKKGLIEKNKNTIEIAEGFSIMNDVHSRIKNYNFKQEDILNGAKGVIKGGLALGDMVLWWIILGIILASLAGAYIPVHFFHKFMGPTLLGLVVTLALATVIEVCSEGSSPLAFEIYRQTGAIGNSFVFLMAGVATDYTEIGLLWANVGKRVALWMPLVAVPQILALGLIANLFLK